MNYALDYSTETFFIEDQEREIIAPIDKSIDLSTSPIIKQSFETMPLYRKAHVSFKETELKWWLGKIISVDEDSFSGNLEDLKGNESIVEFEKDILAPSDISLLTEGTLFTYSVYYKDTPTGRKYGSKLSLSSPKKWHTALEEKSDDLISKYFPDNLLD